VRSMGMEMAGNEGRGHSLSAVSMSHSNALPLFDLSLELRVALLESADVVKLPLSRLTSGKRVARSLQGNLVGRVDRDVW